jgi:hypothetical protein
MPRHLRIAPRRRRWSASRTPDIQPAGAQRHTQPGSCDTIGTPIPRFALVAAFLYGVRV